MQAFSDECKIKNYLCFIVKQLIDIKYELKELKDIEKHGVQSRIIAQVIVWKKGELKP